jgi:hypothetical protein
VTLVIAALASPAVASRGRCQSALTQGGTLRQLYWRKGTLCQSAFDCAYG